MYNRFMFILFFQIIIRYLFLIMPKNHYNYNGLNNMIIDLFFLRIYSPFLNLIENVFSKWKNIVSRSEAQSAAEKK